MRVKIGAISVAKSFRMRAGIESDPVAFQGFILKSIFCTYSSVTCMASMSGKGVPEGLGTWSWSS